MRTTSRISMDREIEPDLFIISQSFAPPSLLSPPASSAGRLPTFSRLPVWAECGTSCSVTRSFDGSCVTLFLFYVLCWRNEKTVADASHPFLQGPEKGVIRKYLGGGDILQAWGRAYSSICMVQTSPRRPWSTLPGTCEYRILYPYTAQTHRD